MKLDREMARYKLSRCGVPVGSDFHRLDSETVLALVAEADADGYRAPRNANGSRGRYYHSRLQRAAQRPAH